MVYPKGLNLPRKPTVSVLDIQMLDLGDSAEGIQSRLAPGTGLGGSEGRLALEPCSKMLTGIELEAMVSLFVFRFHVVFHFVLAPCKLTWSVEIRFDES